MTDEEIAKIYAEGNTKSHTAGLRAVYEAHRNDRLDALEKGLVYIPPSAHDIAEARATALKQAKKEHLSAEEQKVVQDEAEAELVAKGVQDGD